MNKKLLLIIMMAVLLTSCKSTNKDMKVETIHVYNPFEYTFINYSTDQKRPVYDSEKKDVNRHQYAFDTTSSLFTSGDSIENGFEIMSYQNGAIQTDYRLKNTKTDAIFPLAQSDSYTLFFIADYSKAGLPVSRIVRFNKYELHEYRWTEGAINKGAIIENTLYYTTYNKATDTYSLLKLNLEDYENRPELIEDGRLTGDVFVFNNQLAQVTEKDIIYGDHSYKKASINYYDNESGKLIQMDPNSKNNNQLQLTVVDVEANTLETTIENVVGVDFTSRTLRVYCLGEIREVTLE